MSRSFATFKGRALVFSALFVSFVRPVSAIVNIEDIRSEEPPTGFSGQLAFSAAGERGNTDKSSLGLGARTQWSYPDTLDFIVINYNVGETDGNRDVNNTFVHARHIQKVTPVVAWEAFAQLNQNEFQRLSHRVLVGGGGRFTVLAPPDGTLRLVLGAGAFREREKLDDEPGTTDAGVESTTRANLYLLFNMRVNESVRFQTTTYYQPSFEDTDDFRALEQAALAVKLTDRLDLKLQLDVTYDSRPPQGIERRDLSYRTGIEFRF